MSRTKIELPLSFLFTCQIPVRITDINYGGHAGNDTVLSIIHEARMQFLKSIGYTEMDFAGTGLIMTDVAIEFKSEIFYGNVIIASVVTGEVSKIGFELLYKLEIVQPLNSEKKVIAAIAKTGMICYDYEKKKIVSLPEEVKDKLK
jgi:acyl-CoA thioester hydrolase